MIAFLFVWADKQHNTYLDKYVFPTLKIQTSPIFLDRQSFKKSYYFCLTGREKCI